MELEVISHSKESLDAVLKMTNYFNDTELSAWHRQLARLVNKTIIGLKSDFSRIYKLCVAYHSVAEYYGNLFNKTKSERCKMDYLYRCSVSFFFISVEAGILNVNDKFITSKAFREIIDTDDFEKITKELILKFDYRQCVKLIGMDTDFSKIEELELLGLNSALILTSGGN